MDNNPTMSILYSFTLPSGCEYDILTQINNILILFTDTLYLNQNLAAHHTYSAGQINNARGGQLQMRRVTKWDTCVQSLVSLYRFMVSV